MAGGQKIELSRPDMKGFFGDRIQINSLLIVLCFVSVLALSSQSAASYPTYLLALSMALTVRQWNDVFSVSFSLSIIAVLLYLCATSFWSDPFSWRGTLGIFARGLLVFFFVIAMAECQLRGQVQRWLSRAMAVVGLAAAMAAIGFYIYEDPPGGRLAGLGQLDNPVVVGLVFGAILILLLEILVFDPSSRWKAAAWVGVIVVGSAVFLSGSRNAVTSATVGSIIFLLSWRIADRQRFVAATVATGLILAVVIGSLLSTSQGSEWLLPRGGSFRLDIWARMLDRILADHLFFGAGILTPDSFEVSGQTFTHPHNMYLAVLFQGGVLGVALFAVLIAWSFVELLACYEQRSAKLALGLISMALTSYLLDGHELVDKVGETWFLFWLPVAIALGLAWSRMLRDSSTGSEG